MGLGIIDLTVFILFMAAVVVVSLYAGRKEKDSEDYFLAGRSLTWPLIGFSLIASNISTEHFVGMAGAAFGRIGFAIASYEWMSAICLIFVAWWLLPKFLKAGIYTMPEYLEWRYDQTTRTIMSVYLMILYVICFLATVVYSGAVALNTIFDLNIMFENKFSLSPESAQFWSMITSIWIIGIIAGSYTIYGGLKAVVWSDLLQGAALLIGGAVVAFLGLRLIGDGNIITGWTNFAKTNADKLHTVLPWNDPDIPWLAVFVGGLWIPNIFYWGLNQFITQRTLGAKSLAEGQKGVILAAWLKLLIPFIIVIPGIMAAQLYAGQIENGDGAYPHMIKVILPSYLRGAMFAALAGAVMSSFNSGLNSAATIFTLDIYKKFINKNADSVKEVKIGRITTSVIVIIACLWAPVISSFEGVFRYIQEIWGFITPGIVAAFLVGMIFKKVPPLAAKAALILGAALYSLFRIPGWIMQAEFDAGNIVERSSGWYIYKFSTIAFLHHMAIIFIILAVIMLAIRAFKPLREEKIMPVSKIDVKPYKHRWLLGGITIATTILLYVLFW
jgi:SSS family solute:Na+ symporter